jgi:hypothetical protein
MHAAQKPDKQGGKKREFDHGALWFREASHTSTRTGKPISAVPLKKLAQP